MVKDESAAKTAPVGDGEAPRPRSGRPRKYASDADRVRAFRARQKAREQQVDIDSVETATPSEVVGTLERTLTDLRAVTETAVEQFSLAARQITAAVERLSDPAALDSALHRANLELAQTKATYETELKEVRARRDAALEDRANADAAVAAVDAELAAGLAAHHDEVERLTAEHRTAIENLERSHRIRMGETAEQIAALEQDRDSRLSSLAAEIEALLAQLRESQARADAAEQRSTAADLARAAAERRADDEGESAARHLAQFTAVSEQRIVDLRTAAENAAAATASTITRLEESVEHERRAAADARLRVDALRDELEGSRVEAGRARTAEAALREQLSELRGASTEPEASRQGSRTAPTPG